MTSLSVVSYIERINRMYRLIRTESTGTVSYTHLTLPTNSRV